MRFELHLVGETTGKYGDEETKKDVFRRIQRLDLESAVTYYKFLPFQKLLNLALNSHVFVAPSVTALDGDAEGTPFVLQQMMATGMPAIATFHSDIPYIFGDCQCLLVPERDARAIAVHLQRYVDDPDTLIDDGLKLRNRIRTAFNVQSCADALSDIYDTI